MTGILAEVTWDLTVNAIERNGYTLLESVYAADECAELIAELSVGLQDEESGALRQRGGSLYGTRNVLAHLHV